ncbi:MAG: (2Fe-2S)-binding protein [Elusimicrobiota bacterium]
MPEITIDGKKFYFEEGQTIIQIADRNGIYIPRYCYHPALSVAGNCRMCLVEIEGMAKLQIACATQAVNGMVVHTQSEKVKKARADVLEFLLINHPLDCPICDQVGECYLQDYYMEYGLKKSRIALKDKNRKFKRRDVGKYLILDNERCILCTRCVRFCEEVTKTNELFINSRSDHAFIDIKPESKIENNYSLNIADICPVGAFTSRDFRFKERVYNLKTTESICLGCATGCKIKIQHNNNKIYRILPDPNIYTNTWICDPGRMIYKILYDRRLVGSRFFSKRVEIKEFIYKFSDYIKGKKIAILLSSYLSIEDNFALYYLATHVIKTDMIFAPFKVEQKIEDGILINTDKTPNGAIYQFKDIYGIKDMREFIGDCDLVIGFYDDIKNLKLPLEKTFIFTYFDDSQYINAIGILTYFEQEGSFINWQGFLRKTGKAVEAPMDTISVKDFMMELARLNAIYPDFEKDIKELFRRISFRKEEK